MLGNVNGALIERCVAWDNGRLGNGAVGIWTYDSNSVVIQYNESYNNRTAGPIDGDGFDLDQNVSNSVMQYNYSHGNDGAGYLVYTGQNNSNHIDNVVRYNISQNDGRKNGYAGLYIGGRVYNAELYNNTVYLTPPATGTPAAVRILNIGSSVHLRNNIFQTTGGVHLVNAPSGATDLRFQGNDYWSSGSSFKVKWGSTTHASLGAWRSATVQEKVGSTPVGLNVDPQLTSPGDGGSIGNADLLVTLNAYRLRSTSPLIDTGLMLTALGVDPGPVDFYGSAIPRGPGYDIGAHEF